MATHLLWVENLDPISHVLGTLWAALSGVVLYQLVIRPFVGRSWFGAPIAPATFLPDGTDGLMATAQAAIGRESRAGGEAQGGSRGVRAVTADRTVRSILIFRIGSLGDGIVSVPSLWVVRDRFPAAHVTMLCDRQIGKSYVLSSDLLAGSGAVDDFLHYPFGASRAGRLLQPARMAVLLARLRARRFDLLVYLVPSTRTQPAIARDRRFFSMAGIPRMIGFSGFPALPGPEAPRPLAPLPQEADLLLARLRADGIPTPPPGGGRMDLGLGAAETVAVDAWLRRLPPDGGRPWLGVGPGTKKEVGRWPIERYARVVDRLVERFDVWPVVFGGPEDAAAGARLVDGWGRGWVAAGALGLRASAAAMSRCRLLVGNDTGTIHLAAATGIPCVGVYPSQDVPGLWHPYGPGHRVFRTTIACEGCRLFTCVERGMECILRIDTAEVIEACSRVLEARAGRESTT